MSFKDSHCKWGLLPQTEFTTWSLKWWSVVFFWGVDWILKYYLERFIFKRYLADIRNAAGYNCNRPNTWLTCPTWMHTEFWWQKLLWDQEGDGRQLIKELVQCWAFISAVLNLWDLLQELEHLSVFVLAFNIPWNSWIKF